MGKAFRPRSSANLCFAGIDKVQGTVLKHIHPFSKLIVRLVRFSALCRLYMFFLETYYIRICSWFMK